MRRNYKANRTMFTMGHLVHDVHAAAQRSGQQSVKPRRAPDRIMPCGYTVTRGGKILGACGKFRVFPTRKAAQRAAGETGTVLRHYAYQ
jgi:hypothetical protein